MQLKYALKEVDGCINYENKCYICDNKIRWFAPIKQTYIDQGGREKGEILVDKSCIVSGNELWAELSVIVKCPRCGMKNKYNNIKWKIK